MKLHNFIKKDRHIFVKITRQDAFKMAFRLLSRPTIFLMNVSATVRYISVKRRRVSSDSEKMGDCQTRCGPILSFIYVVMD